MEKILVPTDFSQQAENALETAVVIAKKCNAEIKIMHVIEAPDTSAIINVEGQVSYGDNMDDVFVLKMMEKTKKQLEQVMDNPMYKDIKISYDIKVGNTFKSIYGMITGSSCDLIVMGTQGASGLEEIFIGSNTEKVVRLSTCPVLSLKEKADESAFSDIAFATNMDDDQQGIVDQLKEFQQCFGSKLHIVKINTPNNFQSDRSTKKRMREYVAEHQLENYTLNIFNDQFEGDGIMYFAQDIDAGMIALATHGRTGLSHLISGSIAEEIVNQATRPVLTFNIKNS